MRWSNIVNPTTTVIHSDIGLAWSTIEGTTTTIVKRIRTRAQAKIKDITGTTTGRNQDEAIRALTDAWSIRNAKANLDPNKDNVISFERMEDDFLKDTNNALRLLGKSLDGIKIQFVEINPWIVLKIPYFVHISKVQHTLEVKNANRYTNS